MTSCNDPYTLLGISAFATPEEIRKAYLKAALQCHPDRHPHDTEATQKFQAISHAYTILTDGGEHTQPPIPAVADSCANAGTRSAMP